MLAEPADKLRDVHPGVGLVDDIDIDGNIRTQDLPLRAVECEAVHRSELRTFNGITHHIHYYTYGPYEIWGATGRIIFEFLASGVGA